MQDSQLLLLQFLLKPLPTPSWIVLTKRTPATLAAQRNVLLLSAVLPNVALPNELLLSVALPNVLLLNAVPPNEVLPSVALLNAALLNAALPSAAQQRANLALCGRWQKRPHFTYSHPCLAWA